MGIIEAIKNGFVSIAKNMKLWFLLLVISLIVVAIGMPLLVRVFGPDIVKFGNTNLTPDQMSNLNINWLLFAVLMIFLFSIQTFVNSGILGSVKDIVKTNTVSLANFLGYCKKYFGRLILYILVMTVAVLILMLIAIVIFGLIGNLGKANLTLGIILGIIAGLISIFLLILVGMYGSLVPIVIAAEDKGLGQSLTVPFKFIKEKFWPTMGLSGLLWTIIVVLMLSTRVLLLFGTNTIILITEQVIASIINIFISLVYVSSYMYFYLGNSGMAPSKES